MNPKLVSFLLQDRCLKERDHTRVIEVNLELIIEADLVGKEEPNEIILEDYVVNEVE
jgi:hypothetical protein